MVRRSPSAQRQGIKRSIEKTQRCGKGPYLFFVSTTVVIALCSAQRKRRRLTCAADELFLLLVYCSPCSLLCPPAMSSFTRRLRLCTSSSPPKLCPLMIHCLPFFAKGCAVPPFLPLCPSSSYRSFRIFP